MPMVTIIYVLANLAYFAVVTKMEMMTNPAVAAVRYYLFYFDIHMTLISSLGS